MLQTYPEAGIKMLRSREPGLYTWLSRNDRDWFKVHMPLKRKPKLQLGRVDWKKRDLQLAEEVKTAELFFKNLPGLPPSIIGADRRGSQIRSRRDTKGRCRHHSAIERHT